MFYFFCSMMRDRCPACLCISRTSCVNEPRRFRCATARGLISCAHRKPMRTGVMVWQARSPTLRATAPEGLWPLALLRALRGVGEPAVANHAAGPSGRRVAVRRQCRADRRFPNRTTRGRSRRASCSSRHRSGAGRRRNRRQLASGSESRDHATRHRSRRHRRRLRFPVSRRSPRPGASPASMPIGRPPRATNCLPGGDDSCFASGQMFLSAFAWAKQTTTHPGAHVAI